MCSNMYSVKVMSLCLLQYDPCLLDRWPQKLIAKLNFETSNDFSKEKWTKPTTHLQVQSVDLGICASQDQLAKSTCHACPSDHLLHTVLWRSDHSETGLGRKILLLAFFQGLVCWHGASPPYTQYMTIKARRELRNRGTARKNKLVICQQAWQNALLLVFQTPIT